MKKMLVLFLLIAFSPLVFGQSKGEKAQEKEKKAVEEAVERLKEALLSGDKEELEALVVDELSYGHSSGFIENKEAFVESLSSGKSDFTALELSDQMVRVVGQTSIVRHTLDAEINDNGTEKEITLLVLLVWTKHQGAWKLLARQAVKS